MIILGLAMFLTLAITLAVWFVADFEAISYQATTNFDKS
jgi:hypothetical protein